MDQATVEVPTLSRTRSRSLKILLVSEPLEGGVGRYVLELALSLRARGHRVTVAHGTERIVPAWLDELRSAGITTHALPAGRAPSGRDLHAVWALLRLLQRQGPFDIVHAHSSKAGLLVRLGLPASDRVIYTTHAVATLNPTASAVLGVATRTAESVLGRLTRGRVVAVSSEEHDHLLGLGLPSRRLSVIENAVDVPDLLCDVAARRRWGATPEDRVIGFVGRLTPQKRPLMFVDIMEAMIRAGDDVMGVVLGGGELMPVLMHRISASPVRERIVVEDPSGEVRDRIGALDCLCLPSAYEGFPLVLLEALALGVPVVSSPVGGALAATSDGLCGGVVDEDTPQGFAHCLRDVIARDRFAVSVRCRHHYEERFLHARLVDQIEALYWATAKTLRQA